MRALGLTPLVYRRHLSQVDDRLADDLSPGLRAVLPRMMWRELLGQVTAAKSYRLKRGIAKWRGQETVPVAPSSCGSEERLQRVGDVRWRYVAFPSAEPQEERQERKKQCEKKESDNTHGTLDA